MLGRGGSGIKTFKVTEKTGMVFALLVVPSDSDKDLVILSAQGQAIRVPLQEVPTIGRATQGVRIMRLPEGDKVASAAIV